MEETKNEDPIYHFQLKSYDLIEIVKFSKVDIWIKAYLLFKKNINSNEISNCYINTVYWNHRTLDLMSIQWICQDFIEFIAKIEYFQVSWRKDLTQMENMALISLGLVENQNLPKSRHCQNQDNLNYKLNCNLLLFVEFSVENIVAFMNMNTTTKTTTNDTLGNCFWHLWIHSKWKTFISLVTIMHLCMKK